MNILMRYNIFQLRVGFGWREWY